MAKNLVEACRRGDRQAYIALVKGYSQYVYAICLGMAGNVHDAEDLAQQTLLKGYTDITTLRDAGQFKPWIAQIARNLCIDFLRKQKSENQALLKRPSNNNGELKEYSKLQESLVKLEDKYRLPLILYYFNEQSTADIAATLEISPNTVQTRISRARKQLRHLLDAEVER